MLRLVTPLLLACASAAAELQFFADVGAQPIPFRRVLEQCAGSSHAAMTLRQDWREQLLQAKKDLGTRRVRFHGVLDDDMGTYVPGGTNMARVFESFDWLLQNGIGLIVELSFMPEGLAEDPSKTIYPYKGGTSPPKSFDDFGAFVGQFVRQLISRYGIDQVAQFRFEVWNECWWGTEQMYFELYQTTAAAVKQVDPRLKVGGPATSELSWLRDMLRFAGANGAPLDFLATHLYPTDSLVNASSRTGFVDYLRNDGEGWARQAQLPLVITEFNAGRSPGLEMLNSAYAAAFVTHVAAHVQDMYQLDTLSYWTFSDVAVEEPGVDTRPFHENAYGLLNKDGVPKPVYHAMRMLHELPDNLAPVALAGGAASGAFATASTVDVMVGSRVEAATGRLEVVALVTNFNPVGLPIAAQSVTVSITGLAGWCTDATARLETVDDAHVNPLAAWQAMGSPANLTALQLTELRAASTVPATSVPVAVVTSTPAATPLVRGGGGTCASGSSASVGVVVAPQSVTRITITASR